MHFPTPRRCGEMVNTADLKSAGITPLPVRVRPAAHWGNLVKSRVPALRRFLKGRAVGKVIHREWPLLHRSLSTVSKVGCPAFTMNSQELWQRAPSDRIYGVEVQRGNLPFPGLVIHCQACWRWLRGSLYWASQSSTALAFAGSQMSSGGSPARRGP